MNTFSIAITEISHLPRIYNVVALNKTDALNKLRNELNQLESLGPNFEEPLNKSITYEGSADAELKEVVIDCILKSKTEPQIDINETITFE